ncbi:hypothetical protein RHGRI_016982 [Rhododendron griersonianum]|uniref:Uncharacterized protein n=1 Tax=Rhododendron griersonianum TaxID=479676 RepID=A0AAV6JW63_9ERIC|nr:hypothetical protein RHGRI_016982 [Rhododendron griersonianum]
MPPFASGVLPPEEEFIQPYSGIAPPVYGHEMAYDVPDGIELIDSHGAPWFHHLPLPANAEVTLPPETNPVPRAEAQKHVNAVNALMIGHLLVHDKPTAWLDRCGGGAQPQVGARLARQRPASEMEQEVKSSQGQHSYSGYYEGGPSTSARPSAAERDTVPLRRSSRLSSLMRERQ